MTKPITVAAEDFSQNLVKLINESGLPAFVINQILIQMTGDLGKLAKQQYDSDLRKYNASLGKDAEASTCMKVQEEKIV